MHCHNYSIVETKHGKDRNGNQRWRCKPCKRTFGEPRERLADHLVPMDKVLICLKMLLEGCSVRSIERITGVHRDTILRRMLTAGKRAEERMEQWLKDVRSPQTVSRPTRTPAA